MGTHPIFESDFDCLTEMNEATEGQKLEDELRKLKEEEKLLEELMEKLLNAKLKLKREEVAIRAAILRREQEHQQKPENQDQFGSVVLTSVEYDQIALGDN